MTLKELKNKMSQTIMMYADGTHGGDQYISSRIKDIVSATSYKQLVDEFNDLREENESLSSMGYTPINKVMDLIIAQWAKLLTVYNV